MSRDEAHFADAAPAPGTAVVYPYPRPQHGVENSFSRCAGQRLAHRQQGDRVGLAHISELRPSAALWCSRLVCLTSLVHGDCKPSQFLLHGSRVALLDLDHCGLADPAYDVGNFVASLRQQAVQQSQQAVPSSDRLDRALELGSIFVDAYSAAARTAGPHPAGSEGPRFEDRVEVFVAVSLMRKALRAFARSPQSPIPLRLVAEAHRGLDHPEGES